MAKPQENPASKDWGIHSDSKLCLIRSMLELPLQPHVFPKPGMALAGIMDAISANSARPRYTFMVLDLIVRAAGKDGRAGPYVTEGEVDVPIREWLAAAIAPTASRHHYRKATVIAVREELHALGLLPQDAAEAVGMVAEEVGRRIRISGMTAVSRAVSELVRAGLIKRHYQGYRVDHHNRGAQRQAVYTVADIAREALVSK